MLTESRGGKDWSSDERHAERRPLRGQFLRRNRQQHWHRSGLRHHSSCHVFSTVSDGGVGVMVRFLPLVPHLPSSFLLFLGITRSRFRYGFGVRAPSESRSFTDGDATAINAGHSFRSQILWTHTPCQPASHGRHRRRLSSSTQQQSAHLNPPFSTLFQTQQCCSTSWPSPNRSRPCPRQIMGFKITH